MSREIRLDRTFIHRSWMAIAIAMMTIGAIVVWGMSGGDQFPTFDWVLILGVGVGLICAVVIVVPFVYYRCPQCQLRLSRVAEVKPAIHYYCPRCNIQWDSGWREGRLS